MSLPSRGGRGSLGFARSDERPLRLPRGSLVQGSRRLCPPERAAIESGSNAGEDVGMPTKLRQLALAGSVDRFEVELRRLATDLAQSLFEGEFNRVLVGSRKGKRQRKVSRVAKANASASLKHPPTQMQNRNGPGQWTRDAVIRELGQWLVTSKDLDPAFLKRHGPQGLVDAARRIFGRFDAALNAANLAIAPKLVDKGPARSGRRAWPSMRELARRQRERRSAEPATPIPDSPGAVPRRAPSSEQRTVEPG